MGFTWKRGAASPSHPGRHKAAVLTCRKKSEGTRGTEGGAVTLDKGEKRAELCGPVEVREADMTPEKSTIVKGTGRAGKARGPEGYPLPTEGWLWLYAPRACCRGVPSSVKPICCLSAAWRVKPRVPLVYRDTKLLQALIGAAGLGLYRHWDQHSLLHTGKILALNSLCRGCSRRFRLNSSFSAKGKKILLLFSIHGW